MTTDTATVLELGEIYKRFGEVQVLRGLSLSLMQGDVFGLLGRNGAGKSTAIQIMIGLLEPDRGIVVAFGEPLSKNLVGAQNESGTSPRNRIFILG